MSKDLRTIKEILHELEEDTITYGQFLISLGIILGIFGGLFAWILLT